MHHNGWTAYGKQSFRIQFGDGVQTAHGRTRHATWFLASKRPGEVTYWRRGWLGQPPPI